MNNIVQKSIDGDFIFMKLIKISLCMLALSMGSTSIKAMNEESAGVRVPENQLQMALFHAVQRMSTNGLNNMPEIDDLLEDDYSDIQIERAAILAQSLNNNALASHLRSKKKSEAQGKEKEKEKESGASEPEPRHESEAIPQLELSMEDAQVNLMLAVSLVNLSHQGPLDTETIQKIIATLSIQDLDRVRPYIDNQQVLSWIKERLAGPQSSYEFEAAADQYNKLSGAEIASAVRSGDRSLVSAVLLNRLSRKQELSSADIARMNVLLSHVGTSDLRNAIIYSQNGNQQVLLAMMLKLRAITPEQECANAIAQVRDQLTAARDELLRLREEDQNEFKRREAAILERLTNIEGALNTHGITLRAHEITLNDHCKDIDAIKVKLNRHGGVIDWIERQIKNLYAGNLDRGTAIAIMATTLAVLCFGAVPASFSALAIALTEWGAGIVMGVSGFFFLATLWDFYFHRQYDKPS